MRESFGRSWGFARHAMGLGLLLSLAGASLTAIGAEPESWLGLPMAYQGRSFALKPWPSVELSNLKIQTAHPIEISKAWVMPDFAEWAMARNTQSVRVDAEEIAAKPASLARLGVVDGPSTKRVTRMTFHRLKLRFGEGAFELPSGVMEFAANGTLARIRITLDEHVQLELTPKNGDLAVLLQASGLTWSALPAFKFESVVAQGTISEDRIVLDKIGANSDGGSISGVLNLVGSDKFALKGDLTLRDARVRDLLERLYPRHTLEGMLSANMKVDALGNTFETLGSTLSFSGSYTLRAGSIDKFGLLEGLRRSNPGVAGGGIVRFESISGRFSGAKGKSANVTFQGLDAGALKSSGSVAVSPEGVLSGAVYGTLQSPGGETSARNLRLSGKVDAPVLSVRE